jgi:hypothetical protein
LTLIGLNIGMVMRTSSSALTTGIMSRVIDEQADLTMQRVSFALMGASAEALNPALTSPNSTQQIEYQTCIGFENGLPVLGDVERIEYLGEANTVVWRQNPGVVNERSVVWSQWVPTSLDGEVPNALDDNGNGLVDEPGLCFDSLGPKVNIRLTLSRKDSQGHLHKRTLVNTVTCRN